jgi:hypothetical protein
MRRPRRLTRTDDDLIHPLAQMTSAHDDGEVAGGGGSQAARPLGPDPRLAPVLLRSLSSPPTCFGSSPPFRSRSLLALHSHWPAVLVPLHSPSITTSRSSPVLVPPSKCPLRLSAHARHHTGCPPRFRNRGQLVVMLHRASPHGRAERGGSAV